MLLYPALGGDADIYLLVASNIVNGCGVAISELMLRHVFRTLEVIKGLVIHSLLH